MAAAVATRLAITNGTARLPAAMAPKKISGRLAVRAEMCPATSTVFFGTRLSALSAGSLIRTAKRASPP